MNAYDVVVIGAGHNGLACAALLAKAGLSVAVFERSEQVGGAAVSESPWPGYTVSTASYVCTLLDPWLVAELGLKHHGYSAYRKDPATFNVLAGGRSLLLGADEDANERGDRAHSIVRTSKGFAKSTCCCARPAANFSKRSPTNTRDSGVSPRTRELLCVQAAEIVEGYV